MLDAMLQKSFRLLSNKQRRDQAFIDRIKQQFFLACLLLIMLATLLLAAFTWLLDFNNTQPIYWLTLLVSLTIQITSLLYFYHRGRYQFLAKNLIWSHYFIVLFLVLISGAMASPFVVVFILMPVLSGFLLNERHCKAMLLASALVVLLLIIGQSLPISLPSHPIPQGESLGTLLMTLGFLLTVAVFAAFEVILRIITASMETEKQQFLQQAEYEPLTGMMNYLAFEQLLENSLREKQEVALLYIDLDNFKAINQVHGHVRGDKVLQQVAANISNCMRNQDVVARVKSDEFAILVHLDANTSCQALIANVKEAISKPIQLEQEAITLTAHVGYHSTRDGAVNKASLLAIAKSRLLDA